MRPLKAPFSVNQNWFKLRPITYKNDIYIQRLILFFHKKHPHPASFYIHIHFHTHYPQSTGSPSACCYWFVFLVSHPCLAQCFVFFCFCGVVFCFVLFYLKRFTLFSIMIAHVWMMLLHAWQLQWLGWPSTEIELVPDHLHAALLWCTLDILLHLKSFIKFSFVG